MSLSSNNLVASVGTSTKGFADAFSSAKAAVPDGDYLVAVLQNAIPTGGHFDLNTLNVNGKIDASSGNVNETITGGSGSSIVLDGYVYEVTIISCH